MQYRSVKRICPNCQASFITGRSKVAGNKGKYCSKKCFDEFRHKSRIEEACRHCHAKFFRKPCEVKRGTHVYCSKECWHLGHRNTPDKFHSRIKKTETCWLWTGTKRNGYGVIKYEGVECRAHVLSYELKYGRILPGFIICHRCDNPCCVNPEHLFAGTHSDNMEDKLAKKRQAKGSRQGHSKLIEPQVIEIRTNYTMVRETHKKIAARYGVKKGAIASILSRISWKHI
jgi:hypothetical protein